MKQVVWMELEVRREAVSMGTRDLEIGWGEEPEHQKRVRRGVDWTSCEDLWYRFKADLRYSRPELIGWM